MSLKSFHLFFLATCLGLMGFTAYWSRQQDSRGLLFFSAAGFAGALFYLRWFLRKHRALR